MVRRVPVPASGRKILKGVQTTKADQNIGDSSTWCTGGLWYRSVAVTGRTSASSLAHSYAIANISTLRRDRGSARLYQSLAEVFCTFHLYISRTLFIYTASASLAESTEYNTVIGRWTEFQRLWYKHCPKFLGATMAT